MSSTSIPQPPFGLLLDVDGPIASPVTRHVDTPSIAEDISRMANAGIPVAFNTGRSLDFIADRVIPPLVAAGLGEHARVYSIGEKGAVWAPITPEGHRGSPQIDPEISLPTTFVAQMRELTATEYAGRIFFDETKYTMVSLEMVPGIPFDDYFAAQATIDHQALDRLRELGLGVTLVGDSDYPDAHGEIQVRIEPTVISTDIELVHTGKALGAQRALAAFATSGPLPAVWYTAGDSPSDYAMADWLHAHDYQVTHLDVRPRGPVPEKPYRVITHPGVFDDASAAILLHDLATGLGVH